MSFCAGQPQYAMSFVGLRTPISFIHCDNCATSIQFEGDCFGYISYCFAYHFAYHFVYHLDSFCILLHDDSMFDMPLWQEHFQCKESHHLTPLWISCWLTTFGILHRVDRPVVCRIDWADWYFVSLEDSEPLAWNSVEEPHILGSALSLSLSRWDVLRIADVSTCICTYRYLFGCTYFYQRPFCGNTDSLSHFDLNAFVCRARFLAEWFQLLFDSSWQIRQKEHS